VEREKGREGRRSIGVHSTKKWGLLRANVNVGAVKLQSTNQPWVAKTRSDIVRNCFTVVNLHDLWSICHVIIFIDLMYEKWGTIWGKPKFWGPCPPCPS